MSKIGGVNKTYLKATLGVVLLLTVGVSGVYVAARSNRVQQSHSNSRLAINAKALKLVSLTQESPSSSPQATTGTEPTPTGNSSTNEPRVLGASTDKSSPSNQPSKKPTNPPSNSVSKAINQSTSSNSPSQSSTQPTNSTNPSTPTRFVKTSPTPECHCLLITPSEVTLEQSGQAFANVNIIMADHKHGEDTELGNPQLSVHDGLYIDVHDDGKGHYTSTNFYPGWSAMIFRKSPAGQGDTTITITMTDRKGETYSGQLRVITPAVKYLSIKPIDIQKRIEGDSVLYAGHVRLEPSPNFGNPNISLFAVDSIAGGPCAGSPKTEFQYNGQNDYYVVCKTSLETVNTKKSQGSQGFSFMVGANIEGIYQNNISIPNPTFQTEW